LEGVMIRDMFEHDFPDVHMLESICDPTPWSVNSLRYEINNKDSILKVAVRDDKIVGYVCIRTLLDITHVMKINVLPGDRRNGIGSALFSESMKQLRLNKPDVNSVTLEVRDSNDAATGLYNKFGFRKTGSRRNYYKNPLEDGIVMQLDI
jgi:ribosomal-protein-alanine N-acetyltransferase